MTARAHDKITAGLTDALAFAGGDASKGRMTAPRLTPAQRRALLWLPEDGRWKAYVYGIGEKPDTTALTQLVCSGHVMREGVSPSPDYALTPAGQAMRAQIEKDGAGS